jgi:protein gp37
MGKTKIEWATDVWNPVTGCSRVSPGCAHCYALELASRLRAMGVPRYVTARDGGPASGPAFGVTLHEDVVNEPLRWRKPRRVFVNSMSDLFHEEIPDEFIERIWATMTMAHQHTFQILTKRPERAAALVPEFGTPLVNVWLGVSIENRRYVGRADVLRATPAAVRFISAEPLLGPLVWWEDLEMIAIDGRDYPLHQISGTYDDRDTYTAQRRHGLDLDGIDWLIVGGESGSQPRPVRHEWIRDLRDYATAAGTAFFFKQWGGRTPKAGGRVLDGRTWDEEPIAQPEPEEPQATLFGA